MSPKNKVQAIRNPKSIARRQLSNFVLRCVSQAKLDRGKKLLNLNRVSEIIGNAIYGNTDILLKQVRDIAYAVKHGSLTQS
jgi:hypothetical protein